MPNYRYYCKGFVKDNLRSFYVYPKGNGDFGVRCVECEYQYQKSKEVAKNAKNESKKVLY